MQIIATICLVVSGIIHLLPLAGVLGAQRLSALYGLEIDNPNLEILMRHRAVLFGLLGALLISAVFRTHLQGFAISAGLVSAVSFRLLAWTVGGYNSAMQRVVQADILAILCLLTAGTIYLARS